MSEKIEFNLQSFFPYVVRLFYRDISQSIQPIYQSRYELSVDEWRTMANLHEFEPLSAKEIVSRSSINKVNVSRAIASLQTRGFLERHIDPSDRRRVLLRLTTTGKDVMTELVPALKTKEEELLSCLNAKEHQTLLALMEKMRSHIGLADQKS